MIARRFVPALPVEIVAVAGTGQPTRLQWRGRVERVTLVETEWVADYGWWQGESAAIRRRYSRLRTAAGMRCVVYRDLDSGCWYLAGIAD